MMVWSKQGVPAFLVSMGLLVGSALAIGGITSALKYHQRKAPIEVDLKCSSLPTQTDSWVQLGQDHLEKSEIIETLGTRNYLTRQYITRNEPDSSKVKYLQLHLAYYTGMVDTVPHVPDRCFVAGGVPMAGGPYDVPVTLDQTQWVEDKAASSDMRAELGDPNVVIYTMRLGPNSRSPGSRVRLPRGIENLKMRVFQFRQPGSNDVLHAGYFFIANGGLTAQAQDVRLLAFDLKSYYAFYQKVQFSSPKVSSPEELAAHAALLLNEVLPDIMLTVPDWTEVIRGNYPSDNPRGIAAKATH